MRELRGIGVGPGIAIGRASVLDRRRVQIPTYHVGDAGVGHELDRFKAAHDTSVEQLVRIVDEIESDQGASHYHVVEAHKMMLEDAVFVGEVRGLIEQEQINAEWAIRKAVLKFKKVFDALVANEYLEERSTDVDFVGERILRNLRGESMGMPQVWSDTVVVAHMLSAPDTAVLVNRRVRGFVTDVGGPTGHTAIVARDLEIPAVVGAAAATELIGEGDTIIVDGANGLVIVDPDPSTLDRYRARRRSYSSYEQKLLAARDEPAVTRDGHRVHVHANIELVDELPAVLDHGAEGIGLYRTEYLYIGRHQHPTEDEHYRSYRLVVETMAGRPATVRTIDVGGDKQVPLLETGEELNPALGMRAIRYCLAKPAHFKAQLHGLLRASAHGPLRILLPMVSGLEEIRAAKAIIQEVKRELRAEGHDFDEQVAVGIMVELPAACLIADLLAREVDFFSLGTNDLIQFCLAADRTNEQMAYLYQPFHPGVLRLLERTTRAAREARIPVGMCGEMAGDPLATPILIALGLEELSMSSGAVPAVKAMVRGLDRADCLVLFEQVRELGTAAEITARVRAFMSDRFPEHFGR